MLQTATGRFEGDALRVSWERGPDNGCLIAIAWTDCNFGGRRAWFECPRCSQHVAHVYLRAERLACRVCADLTYSSRREGRPDRQMRRARVLRRRVGASGDLTVRFPAKPPRMHWRTYERLEAAEARATSMFLARDIALLNRLGQRLDRIG